MLKQRPRFSAYKKTKLILEVMLLAGVNKARIVLARRKVAVAIFLEAGIEALSDRQVSLLLDIKPMSRANYRLSDQQWLEIQAAASKAKPS